MGKRKPSEEEMYRKNIKREVVFSPFMMTDEDGEFIFHPDVPCPRCDFWMRRGEFAGAFECEVCGFSEIPQYSNSHGYYLFLEGLWKLVRIFMPYKRLRWETSGILYSLHLWWNNWYLLGRHKVNITRGSYMWSWKEKRWFKFM